jgi:hypothetical protein
MATTPKTISLLVKVVDEREGLLDSASTPIIPGMLVEKVTLFTERPKLKPQATAAAAAGALSISPVMVAIEEPYRPAVTTYPAAGSTIDTSYSVAGEAVPYVIPLRGDHLYMFLKTGNNVAAGALLEAAGAGNLQAVSTGAALFRALEAVNNASGSDARIRVEVL